MSRHRAGSHPLSTACDRLRTGLRRVLILAAAGGLGACGPVPDEGAGLLGESWALPFPSAVHLDQEGHVDLRDLPAVDGVTVPVGRSAWRDGFSPGQVAVVQIDGVDPESLPHWRSPTPGEGGVRLADLTAGTWLPTFAELDAGADSAEVPALLVRPLVSLPPGHRIAVVLTTQAVDRPDRFEALLSRRPPSSIADLRLPTLELLAGLEGLGLESDQVALAWDFPVADPLRPLRLAIRDLQGFSTDVELPDVREEELAAPLAWRTAVGSFTVPSVLDEGGRLRLEPDGSLTAHGTMQADLWVHVPDSARDLPAGSVPVMIFGHGIFGAPEFYLDGDSPSDLARLANDGPFIIVASRFTGLSRNDVGLALSAANNLTRVPELTEQLVQGQLALRVLADWVDAGGLDDHPVVQAADGGSLISGEGPVYYGISLGGIQGALGLSLGMPARASVLHVGGAMWSTMLERSSNFEVFDGVVRTVVPRAVDRALLIAWTQLHWDLVDPYSDPSAMLSAPVLLQEAVHDEQVPNLTTRALARSAGMVAVEPLVEPVWGLDATVAPATVAGAYVQLDPERAPPIDANRPAEVTGAHTAPRGWSGTRRQTLTFLRPQTLGVVEQPCGDAACSRSNPGP